MNDRAVGDHEISIDELDKVSGGFNVGAAVMDAYTRRRNLRAAKAAWARQMGDLEALWFPKLSSKLQ